MAPPFRVDGCAGRGPARPGMESAPARVWLAPAVRARLTCMTRRLGPSAVITSLLAAVLSAWSTPAASAADPMYQAPVVGQCFDMSPEELALPSHPEAPVDCAGEHTSQVIAVALLPDDLT